MSIMAQFEILTYIRHLYTVTLTYSRTTRNIFISVEDRTVHVSRYFIVGSVSQSVYTA